MKRDHLQILKNSIGFVKIAFISYTIASVQVKFQNLRQHNF